MEGVQLNMASATLQCVPAGTEDSRPIGPGVKMYGGEGHFPQSH